MFLLTFVSARVSKPSSPAQFLTIFPRMKTFMAVALLAAVASAQQFNRPLAWMNPDLIKYQGPYAGQYYDNNGQYPLGNLGQQGYLGQQSYPYQQGFNGLQGYNGQQGFNDQQVFNGQQRFNGQQGFNDLQGFNGQQEFNGQRGFNGQQGYNGQQETVKTPYLAQEIPMAPVTSLLSLDQIVKLPLFHEYLNIPLFKQYFPTQEFQHYIVSPLFQQSWTNPMFQQLFMDGSMFYKHIYPLFQQYKTGNDYYEPAKDMLPPTGMYDTMSSYNNEAIETPFRDSYLPEVKKPAHPLMVYLFKKYAKTPMTLAVTDTPPTPLADDESNADLMDHILAEQIVKTVMSQYNHEGPARKQDPNFRAEDVKLTYDSLMQEEPVKKQDPNFRPEDVKLTYDSIIPTEPETVDKVPELETVDKVPELETADKVPELDTVDKVPAVDANLVSLTTEEPTMTENEKEEKAIEILNAIKAKRFSRFAIPKKPTEIKLIGAEEPAINNLRYDVYPGHRMVRQSGAYRTLGDGGLEVVPVSLSQDSYANYAGASGQEMPVEKSGDDDSYNLA